MNTTNLLLIKLALATPWLIWLSVCDWKRHELPNRLTFGGAAVMAAVALAVGVDYLLVSLTVAFLSSLFMLLPFYLRAAGAGDVKMMFAAGLTAGPGVTSNSLFNTLNLLLLISFAGIILVAVMLVMKWSNPERLKHYLRCIFDWRYDRAEGRKSMPPPDTFACRVPFGVAIAAGLWCNLLIQLAYVI